MEVRDAKAILSRSFKGKGTCCEGDSGGVCPFRGSSNFIECYICFGPHVVRECPKVVAMDTEEECDGDPPNLLNSVHLIGAL